MRAPAMLEGVSGPICPRVSAMGWFRSSPHLSGSAMSDLCSEQDGSAAAASRDPPRVKLVPVAQQYAFQSLDLLGGLQF
ncbi:hypothetical protein NDU88_006208 [Pleurodeles waltl]|uniref:Uncharacterized protein n=1 Tax=Pleurodeles waltl TaxID=8319 RepID=A0AAV7N6K6_PLEWA|nr:hypothetical protein NDU88_006208 [Pleurodeles waltl]